MYNLYESYIIRGYWWTPLHVAAARGWEDMAKILLENGASKDKEERFWFEDGSAVYSTDTPINARTLAIEIGWDSVSQVIYNH